MRILLAIGGLLIGAAAIFTVWFFMPRDSASSGGVAQAQAPATSTAPAAAPSAETSEGSLRVCNQTANPVSIALGYKAPRGWQSEGWWVAASGECKNVYNGKLDARYYYIFAADDIGGGVWDGTNFMCSRDETFTIFGVEDCLARGYERTGFFEVDTQSKTNWTLQLTDGEVVSTGSDASDEALPLEGEMPLDGGDEPEFDETPNDKGADQQ